MRSPETFLHRGTKSGKVAVLAVVALFACVILGSIPTVSAETIGYLAPGVGWDQFDNYMYGSMFTTPSDKSGTVEYIKAYVKGSVSDSLVATIYKHSDSTLVGSSDVTGFAGVGEQWVTFSFTTAPELAGNTEYVLAVSAYSGAGVYIAYDNGASNQGHNQAHEWASPSDPNLPSTASFNHTDHKYSIYCTYALPSLSPVLDISPESGPTGTQVTFTGSGFTPNAEVNIYYLVGTEWIMKISATDGSGCFTSDSFTIDALHGSDVQFVALDYTTMIWSNVVHFTVSEMPSPHIEISPTEGSTNVIVTITGIDFTPSCTVSIFYREARIKYIFADSDGKFTTFFTIPANAPMGPNGFVAYDHVSDQFSDDATYNVTSQQMINPILSISPTTGWDVPITFTGSDFTPSALVQIGTYDSTGVIVTIGAPYTDNAGAFEITIIPWDLLTITGTGSLKFHALDTATGAMSNEVVFTLPGVLPTTGPAGSLVELFLPFTGDIATAGYLVGTLFFVAPLTIIGLAVVAAAKARQFGGMVVLAFFLLSVFICVMTSLFPWWFLVTIIAVIALIFARGWFGRD